MIPGNHWLALKRSHKSGCEFKCFVTGFKTGNHLHECHRRYWIEEMQADESFWASGRRGQFADAQGGGIGCEESGRLQKGLNFTKYRAFRVDVSTTASITASHSHNSSAVVAPTRFAIVRACASSDTLPFTTSADSAFPIRSRPASTTVTSTSNEGAITGAGAHLRDARAHEPTPDYAHGANVHQ
jgi:hypothetical protein